LLASEVAAARIIKKSMQDRFIVIVSRRIKVTSTV